VEEQRFSFSNGKAGDQSLDSYLFRHFSGW